MEVVDKGEVVVVVQRITPSDLLEISSVRAVFVRDGLLVSSGCALQQRNRRVIAVRKVAVLFEDLNVDPVAS